MNPFLRNQQIFRLKVAAGAFFFVFLTAAASVLMLLIEAAETPAPSPTLAQARPAAGEVACFAFRPGSADEFWEIDCAELARFPPEDRAIVFAPPERAP